MKTRNLLILITKAYKTVSNEALSAIARIMPIEQAMQLHTDKRATSRGNLTNAVRAALKKIKSPTKI
jgi:rRNA processing protein Krr1/Pno1